MIVVCGEALVDVFVSDAVLSNEADAWLHPRLGGAPFNVARALARLGQPAAFLGTLSTDALGRRLRQALAADGVDTALAAAVDAPTTLAMVEATGGAPRYTFHGANGADRRLAARDLPPLPPQATALHLGSYASVVEPVGEALRDLVRREHPRRFIAYDPNVRLAVEPDAARWRDALRWMLPRLDLLKLSEEDLQALHPGADIDALARAWLAQGVRLVVLTRGAAGARAWTMGAVAERPAAPALVVDTVGAGDSFAAALLTWLAERSMLSREAVGMLDAAQLAQMLGFAARAAALTCERRGAEPPRRHELEVS